MMQIDKSTMTNSTSLLVVQCLHLVSQPLERNLLLNKLRMRRPKMKAMYKSSMTDSQTLKNSGNPMNQALKVQAKIIVPALLKSI